MLALKPLLAIATIRVVECVRVVECFFPPRDIVIIEVQIAHVNS